MDAQETYLFDLCGYIVVPGVLTPEEVAAANTSVDAHAANALHQSHRKGNEALPDDRELGTSVATGGEWAKAKSFSRAPWQGNVHRKSLGEICRAVHKTSAPMAKIIKT